MKYKVCVYAICKNEEQFVEKWYNSMKEADWVVVLDTGSDDNTVKKLKELGAIVEIKEIKPWRFDVARNECLKLVPSDADICVSTDLDEEFEEGWREKLENAWTDDAKRASYRYTWSFNEDGSEGSVFWIDQIHANGCFKWIHPVHEVLDYLEEGHYKTVMAEGVQLNHHPDSTKSRGQYLPLLELAVKERPNDDRNTHYLGREYMYYEEWDKCIETLKQHLKMPMSTWADERCASMRFISRAYINLGDNASAKTWLLRAVAEAPHLREPYIELAFLLYKLGEWEGVIYMSETALKIQDRPKTYITEASAWGSMPYDLASIGYFYTNQYAKALDRAEKANEIEPDNERIKNNIKLIKDKIENKAETEE